MEEVHWLLAIPEKAWSPLVAPHWVSQYPKIPGPLKEKLILAWEIVGRYHSAAIADALVNEYLGAVDYKKKDIGKFAQKAVVSKSELKDGKIWIVRLVSATGFVKSNSEARQKIIEGAVTLNGEKITDPDAELLVKEGDIVKVGKKRLAVVKIATTDKHG
jgi:tyrosyl-tRNA synthetase